MSDFNNLVLIGILILTAWIIIPDPLEFLDIILLPILGSLVLLYIGGA